MNRDRRIRNFFRPYLKNTLPGPAFSESCNLLLHPIFPGVKHHLITSFGSEHFREYFHQTHLAKVQPQAPPPAGDLGLGNAKKICDYSVGAVFVLPKLLQFFVRERTEIQGFFAFLALLTPEMAMIGAVFTDEPYRRRGFARDCTANLCRDLVERQKEVYLFYEKESVPLANLYGSLGFEETGIWVVATLKPGNHRDDPYSRRTPSYVWEQLPLG